MKGKKGGTGTVNPEQIGQKLLAIGLIDQTQLNEALDAQKEQGGGSLINILVSFGYVTPHACLQFLGNLPSEEADLSSYELSRELVAQVPKRFALEHEAIPIDRSGSVLTVGMTHPLDASTIRELEETTGLTVKAVMCSAVDVRQAIERYYPIGDAAPSATPKTYAPEDIEALSSPMRLLHVARLIEKIDSLPALPETVLRVRQAMDNPDSSVAEVADIIMMDPPMAAKVLSVANSAAYGFRQRVSDVTHAISLLGLRETFGLVLSASVQSFYARSANFDYRQFWAESMDCASASRIIAKHTGRQKAFGLFSAALLHDLGHVALTEMAPELYSQVDQNLPPDQLLAREEEVLGITHTEAGHILASRWDLPSEISEPIRFHHRPEWARNAQENVWIVSLAIAVTRFEGHEEELDALFVKHGQILDYLGLDPETVGVIINEFIAQGDSTAEVPEEGTRPEPAAPIPVKRPEPPLPKKIVICPKCEHRMSIPPERANRPGRCTKCGTLVNLPTPPPPVDEPEPMAPVSGSAVADGVAGRAEPGVPIDTAVVAPPAPTESAAMGFEDVVAGKAALSIALWSVGFGVGCSVFLGLAVMLVSQLFTLDPLEITPYLPLRGFDIGLLYGLIVGSIWGLVRATDLPFGVYVVTSAAIGLVLSLVFFVLIAVVAAPSEIGLPLTVFIGGIGGAAFGFAAAWVKEFLSGEGLT